MGEGKIEPEILIPPFCECTLWLFPRISSVMFFFFTHNSMCYQTDVKQTCVYLSISFLIPTQNFIYGIHCVL